jgi:hypothetical protein
VPETDDRLTVDARCVATTLALRRLHG